jgi:hypothetical protein
MRGIGLFFGCFFGLGLGLSSGCHGNCEAGAHGCCAGSHCSCADQHDCYCQDSDQHNCANAQRLDYDCTVTWEDAQGQTLGSDVHLYENFVHLRAVVSTCKGFELDYPDRPEGAIAASCACEPVDPQPSPSLAAP